MTRRFQGALDFEATAAAADDDVVLIIDLDGFEGPLHVLLELARSQKVDLLRLSITRLADQYLAFVRDARGRRFALAAEYLVMAAWLAFLKSRLLLPVAERPTTEEPPPEILAAQLSFRLAKLDAMRRAAAALEAGLLLGRDVFARGDPGAARIVPQAQLEGDLHELVTAYVGQRRREGERVYAPRPSPAYRLDDARDRLRGLLPTLDAWTPLTRVAPAPAEDGPTTASLVASTLSASLEFVREGLLEVRQASPFGDLWLRAREAAA